MYGNYYNYGQDLDGTTDLKHNEDEIPSGHNDRLEQLVHVRVATKIIQI